MSYRYLLMFFKYFNFFLFFESATIEVERYEIVFNRHENGNNIDYKQQTKTQKCQFITIPISPRKEPRSKTCIYTNVNYNCYLCYHVDLPDKDRYVNAQENIY